MKSSKPLSKPFSKKLSFMGIFAILPLMMACQSMPKPTSVHGAGDELAKSAISYGTRPFYLLDDMDEGKLKQELKSCQAQTPKRTEFSIAHRGAPLQCFRLGAGQWTTRRHKDYPLSRPHGQIRPRQAS